MIPTEALANFMLDNDLDISTIEEVAKFIVSGKFQEYADFTHIPVGVQEFIESPYYMNAKGSIYPEVMTALIELNEGDYIEAVLTGSIGSAKTTVSLYTQAYQLYRLSCHRNPHQAFGLDPASEIMIIFQNINATLAKAVDFERFKSMILSSPYFQHHFPYDKSILSELRFPNRIIVKPVTGAATGTIGQNVVGGLIDEVNFMAVTQKSKRGHGEDNTYNQAMALYNSLAMRRKTRFMRMGKVEGILCLSSSRNYPGQFTDIKEDERAHDIAEKGCSSIYLYDKRVWDIKPWDFCGDKFPVFIGDATRNPRVLEEDEEISVEDRDLITLIPVEFRTEFRTDLFRAMRDIAGLSTLAKHPFIFNVEAANSCFDRVPSILSLERVDFRGTRAKAFPVRIKDKEEPRFVHMDFALTGDSAGVACGYIKRFVEIDRGGVFEILPEIVFDFILEVAPPKGGEIEFHKIRSMLYKLRDLGLPLKWVTTDSWQSHDNRQILKQQGFYTGIASMDKDTKPYDFTKSALYDKRLLMPRHLKVRKELFSLEFDAQRQKIDHPPNGSKDCADAVAGVVYGLTTRRELYVKHGVPLTRVNETIRTAVQKAK